MKMRNLAKYHDDSWLQVIVYLPVYHIGNNAHSDHIMYLCIPHNVRHQDSLVLALPN